MIIVMSQISTCMVSRARVFQGSSVSQGSKETPISFAMAWFKMYIPFIFLVYLLKVFLYVIHYEKRISSYGDL